MIVNKVIDLVDFIKAQSAVNCVFGTHDDGPIDYPLVQVVTDKAFTVSTENQTIHRVIVPVTIRIIVARENELDALAVLEKLVSKLNSFDRGAGHYIAESGGDMIYTNDTYEITLTYNIKTILP